MKTKLLLLLLLANFSIYAQYTAIPDVNFEKKLIALGLDSGVADGQVLTSNINLVTSLDVSYSTITDLTGIEDFTGLTILECSNNNLSTLNLSKNTLLSKLNCSYNKINLDVSKNINLTYLDCTSNLITALNLSSNIALQYLHCGNNGNKGNNFNSLNLSKNSNLKELDVFNGFLTNLDLSSNPALEKLNCSSNNLSSLDLTFNTALITVLCTNNKLLDLKTATNKMLKYLACSNNQISSLDLSENNNLVLLNCSGNNLTTLNLKNGNNANLLENTQISFQYLYSNMGISYSTAFLRNPSLNCIAVDDVDYMNTNWTTKKEGTAYFSPIDCSLATQISDPAFEDKLIALGIDTDGKNGVVLNSSIATVATLDVSNSNIADLKGIEGFKALTTLNCSGNLLKKINLSQNTVFNSLNCSNNAALICIQVADIDYATTNWIVNKDLIANFSLDCTIYTLIPDSKFEDKLIALGIDKDGKNGKVATESVSLLTSLDVSSSMITDLTGIQDFKSLTFLECGSNQLTSLNVSNNVSLTRLQCSSNKLTTLDLSKNLALQYLFTAYNKLGDINLSANVNLIDLSCHNNELTALDISNNIALKTITCESNKLLSLNLKNGKNTLLTVVNFQYNSGLKCILVDDTNYSNTNWSGKKDTNAFYSHYDCSTITSIPDSKFEDKLISLGIDTDGKNGFVATASISSLTALDVSNSSITNLTGIEAFLAITALDCSGNQLKKLNLSNNTAIATLNCSNNPALICIQVANVTDAANWTTIKDATTSFNLDCTVYTLIPDSKFEEKLIALGIDKDGTNGKIITESIVNVTSLNVTNSSITDLTGIQDFASLQILYCYNNQLTSLDVSKNPGLTRLECDSNKLTSLDITKNINLNILECQGNMLTSLDLSQNKALTRIFTHSNALTSLNLKNGNNTLLTNSNVNFSGNSNLKCILVDDVAYSDANWANKKNATTSYNIDCTPYTLIPDTNFEDKLIALGIDTDGKNGKVVTASISSITELDVSNSSITDLTGVQDFIALTSLNVSGNNLISLNTSNNKNLTELKCNSNELLEIEVKGNIALENLNAAFNKLNSLDISQNAQLTSLEIYSNNIGALDLTNNTKLSTLDTGTNLLESLDVSKNLLLNKLDCQNNKIIALNLSDNNALTILFCNNNLLKSLNLKNGVNNKFDKTKLSFLNNPELTCIEVDDIEYSNANWADKNDPDASYNLDCATYTIIPDSNFEDKLIALGIDGDGKNGKVKTESIANITNLNVTNSAIADLTGIQDFKMLKSLNCGNNAITALNVSNNQLLDKLYCSFNNISTLDLSANTALTVLSCSFNMLTTLDVSANTSLKQIECSNNDLSYLNIQNGNNTNMQSMLFGNFTSNPKLKCILVDDAAYSTSNWALAKDPSSTFNIDCTPYTLIPDSNFEAKLIALGIDTDGKNGKVITASISTITTLDVNRSNITDLTGLQDFTSLESLSCYNNNLISLDVSKNLKLVTLECMSSTLTILDVSKNIALENLYCYSNDLTTLDVSKNKNLKILDCHFNNLTTLNLKNGFNTNFTTLDVSSKVNLPCILVDDEIYSNANWANYKNLNSTFSNNCDVYTTIPDPNFEQKLIDLGIDLDGKNGKVLTSSIAVINDLNVQLSEINDLTGIEGFASLQYLNCQFNNLTTLDLSGNLNLIELYCHGNLMTRLNVSANTELTTLQTNKNKLTDLDVSKNTKLVYINTSENALKILNLKNGNNINFEGALLFKNPALTCIMVDSPTFASTSGIFFKDDTASYSANCTLGLEESVFDKVVLYPNPTNGEVNIQNISLEKASVFNALGQLVKTVKLDKNNENHIVDLAGLPKGIYYIYLINQDAASAKKIIVE